MNFSADDMRRMGVSCVAGVALAYYWRGHGKLAAVGSFLLGSFVASHAYNIISPKAASSHIEMEPMVIS
jgi:hypothetical protein